MTDDLREAAQLVQRDTPKKIGEGHPTLFVAEVVGDIDLVRGLAFRAMRLATPEDVRALMPEAVDP